MCTFPILLAPSWIVVCLDCKKPQYCNTVQTAGHGLMDSMSAMHQRRHGTGRPVIGMMWTAMGHSEQSVRRTLSLTSSSAMSSAASQVEVHAATEADMHRAEEDAHTTLLSRSLFPSHTNRHSQVHLLYIFYLYVFICVPQRSNKSFQPPHSVPSMPPSFPPGVVQRKES